MPMKFLAVILSIGPITAAAQTLSLGAGAHVNTTPVIGSNINGSAPTTPTLSMPTLAASAMLSAPAPVASVATVESPVVGSLHAAGLMETAPAGVLRDVVARVERTVAEGRIPVVIFDIDDTLVTTNYRKYEAMMAVAAAMSAPYPNEAARIGALSIDDVWNIYDVKTLLVSLNIGNAPFIESFGKTWLREFLKSDSLTLDRALPGAVEHVKLLLSNGAKIVYMTGRDEPNMGLGTRKSMNSLGFPMGKNTLLILKSDEAIPDVDYKKDKFSEIARMGEIVAGYENEPVNINAFVDYFPGMTPVFLRTMNSQQSKQDPISKYDHIAEVTDYLD